MTAPANHTLAAILSQPESRAATQATVQAQSAGILTLLRRFASAPTDPGWLRITLLPAAQRGRADAPAGPACVCGRVYPRF
jgi:hypothetical protein